MSTQTIARDQTAKASENSAESFGVTPVNKVKRVHERGRYDRKTVYEILDAALVCHIAYVIDGRPYCTPTSFWREGDHLYWHGSSASRMIRTQGQGVPVCLTVTHLDALVMARSGFHHSVNYRAVMAFGTAHIIDDVEKKLKLMDRFIDRVYPGRSKLIRQPNQQEFKATTMMGMEIEHCSGKTLICGHTRQASGLPWVLPGTICIDTGVYDGDGWLTCLHVETGDYWQANNRGESRAGNVSALALKQ